MSTPTLSRREWLRTVSVALAATGLEAIVGNAEARKSDIVPVEFDYQTILGEARDETAATLEREVILLGQLADFLSGRAGLAIPEDAIITAVKPKRLTLYVERRGIAHKRMLRVVSRGKPRWDPRREAYVVPTVVEFDLPRYVARQDRTLSELVSAVADGYRTQEEKAQALLCFVQTAIAYDAPKVERVMRDTNADYVRHPRRTLLEKTGDCKDTAVLYASCLYHLRVRPVFLEFEGHVNVGVPLDFEGKRMTASPDVSFDAKVQYRGKTYFIAETTPDSPVFIGKLMEAQRGKEVRKIIPI